MELDEPAARRVLLAQALEGADTQHRLLTLGERERIEQDAWQAAPESSAYLQERARRIVASVAPRDARIAALEHAHASQPVLAWLLPLAAFFIGALLDRIDDPHQVNMLSPPLLLFLAWNLAVYLALLAMPFLRRDRGMPPPAATLLGRWLARSPFERMRSNLRASVAAQFRTHWWRVAGKVETWRLAQVLHASAAAWAIGVALSIVVGGLVREYRVGWESTLLDPPQVHAFLKVLFAPVVALLPVDGFTMADLERMHFRSGVAVARAEARHWVALYVGLLFVLVVVPRTVLAVHARWRAGRAARRLQVDVGDPYFVAVLSRIGVRRVARFLADAARDAEEVKSAPFSVKRLVSTTERDASEHAREDAIARLLQRVERRLADTMQEIALLHGRHAPAIGSAVSPASRDFILREPVDAPQAGVAGAAAGVAAGALAGAKIDLLTAGMTMGAATLLGALIGGTGALTAARWMNRTTPDGKAMVQLGDEMLDALAADALLRYAALTHDVTPEAKAAAASLVGSDAQRYAAAWGRARENASPDAGLVDHLQADLAALQARLAPKA